MHGMGQDEKRIHCKEGEMFGTPALAVMCAVSGAFEAKATRHDLSEQMGTPSRANRDEVPPPTGVVEPAKPQRPSAMRDSKGDSQALDRSTYPSVAGRNLSTPPPLPRARVRPSAAAAAPARSGSRGRVPGP